MGDPNKKAHIQHDHSQLHVPSIEDGVQTCYPVRLTSRIDCCSTVTIPSSPMP
jgi:hypothetical protein